MADTPTSPDNVNLNFTTGWASWQKFLMQIGAVGVVMVLALAGYFDNRATMKDLIVNEKESREKFTEHIQTEHDLFEKRVEELRQRDMERRKELRLTHEADMKKHEEWVNRIVDGFKKAVDELGDQ